MQVSTVREAMGKGKSSTSGYSEYRKLGTGYKEGYIRTGYPVRTVHRQDKRTTHQADLGNDREKRQGGR
jgi:hypothetical protein